MQTAMHAARLVAVHSALLALLTEQQGEHEGAFDGINATLSADPLDGFSLDVSYTRQGLPMSGEGV